MSSPLDRRSLLRSTAVLGASLASGTEGLRLLTGGAREERPNLLFVQTDQQGVPGEFETAALRTPNLERLRATGVSFERSYCANPVCMPARVAWYTGRPPSETGVVLNRIPLQREVPDLGAWLRRRGYRTAYAGKWHVPGRKVEASFDKLVDASLYGEHGDVITARSAAAFLRDYEDEAPFFLNVGLMQPHDVNYWLRFNHDPLRELPLPEIAEELPPLPPNYEFDPREPESFLGPHRTGQKASQTGDWGELEWRWYLWNYHRHVEMADAELGRVLDALDASPQRDRTLLVFSSDHGDGMARHRLFGKAFLYEEALRVPLVLSWPGRLPAGSVDEEHLVGGLDVAATLCDAAGTEPLPDSRGRSLLGLFGDERPPWREALVCESTITGRMVRGPRFKLITYAGDETAQLFDLAEDPWERKNLAGAEHAAEEEELRERLREWESGLDPVPEPSAGWRSAQRG